MNKLLCLVLGHPEHKWELCGNIYLSVGGEMAIHKECPRCGEYKHQYISIPASMYVRELSVSG